MYYTISIEARCAAAAGDVDLMDRVLTALEGDSRIAAPAIGQGEGTIGTTLCVDGEHDPVRAVERAVAAFRDALREATREEAEIVEIEATQEREDAAALA